MMRQNQKYPEWAVPVLAVLTVLVWTVVTGLIFRNQSVHEYDSVPKVGYAELTTTLKRIEIELKAPVGAPVQYSRTALDVLNVQSLTNRYVAEHGLDARMRLVRATSLGITPADKLVLLQQRYRDRYGIATMIRAAPASSPVMRPVTDQPLEGHLFKAGYGLSCLLMGLLFLIRLENSGKFYWAEVPRLVLVTAFWPVGIWFYPTKVNPIRLTKIVWQFLCGTAATMLSFAAASFAEAAPEVTASVGVQSEKVLANGFVPHKGPIVWTDTTVSFPNNLSFEIATTHATSGPSSSDERDIIVNYARKMWGGKMTAGLGLFDIQPPGKGDIIAPSLGFTHSFGHHSSWFVNGFGRLLTKGDPTRDGFFVGAGVRDSRKYGDVSMDQSIGVAAAKGPFHQDSGARLRYDASLSMPLSRWLKLKWTAAFFKPFVGFGDRHSQEVFGLELDYANATR